MAAQKKKNPRFYTPALSAFWPWLMVPDTKFDDDGQYKVDLLMTPTQKDEFMATIAAEVAEQEKALRASKPKLAKYKVVYPIKEETDENDVETGNFLVGFRQKAKVVREGKEDMIFDVAVFDSKKKPLDPSIKIGTGTKLKLCYNVRVVEDNLGKCIRVKVQPLAAQIIDLVEWSGGDFTGFAEEAGYEAPEQQAAATEPPAGEAADANNPDF